MVLPPLKARPKNSRRRDRRRSASLAGRPTSRSPCALPEEIAPEDTVLVSILPPELAALREPLPADVELPLDILATMILAARPWRTPS